MRIFFCILIYALVSTSQGFAQFPNAISGCYNGSCYTSRCTPRQFTPVTNSAYGNILGYSYTDSQWYYKHVIETGNDFLPNPYGILEDTLKRDRLKRENHRRKKDYTDDVFNSIMNIR
tara:strand:+ start:366 stop:719 length:354 start_codon:yes stop_codon:yes gene_type:complete